MYIMATNATTTPPGLPGLYLTFFYFTFFYLRLQAFQVFCICIQYVNIYNGDKCHYYASWPYLYKCYDEGWGWGCQVFEFSVVSFLAGL